MAKKKETKLNVGKGGYTYTDEDKGIVKEPGGYVYTAEEREKRLESESPYPKNPKNDKYKVTKKEKTVTTPSGDIASVQKTEDVVGPDMSKVNKEEPKSSWTDPHEQARKMLGFKRGGSCMSKGGSTASKRADGCAIRGKTRGRMV